MNLPFLQKTWTFLFYFLLFTYIGAIFSLSMFPSQDGPVHLYYADVVSGIRKHTGVYEDFFSLTNAISPYILNIYVLIGLNNFFSPITSEKMLVCLYLVVFCCGFRYLVTSSWGTAGVISLYAFPFALNRLLWMGFFNFCIATGIALWVCGLWIRLNDTPSWLRSTIFVMLMGLLTVSHPIPLLLSIAFFNLNSSLSIWISSRLLDGDLISRLTRSIYQHKTQLAHLAIASFSLLFMWRFTSPDKLNGISLSLWHLRHQISTLLNLEPISPLSTWTYRAGLACVIALAIITVVIALWKRVTARFQIECRDSLTVFAAACALVYLVAPPAMNGSFLFDERFPIFGVLFISAAAGGLRLSSQRQALLAIGLFGFSCVQLFYLLNYINPYVEKLAVVEQAPKIERSVKGIILMDQDRERPPPSLFFDPIRWAAANYFRRSSAILLNSPWLYSPIFMLGTNLPAGFESVEPEKMEDLLASEKGQQLFRDIDLLVTVNNERDHSELPQIAHIVSQYKLKRMPWSNELLTFYANPERVGALDRSANHF